MVFLPGVILNNIALFLDHILFHHFKNIRIKKPIFIIGNARSGTTFFHRVLCMDKNRYAFFKTYEVFFPSLLFRKMSLCLIHILEWLFKDKLTRWMNKKETALFSNVNHIHKVSMNQAEEEEALFFFRFWSVDLHFLFPFLSKMEDMNQFETLSGSERKKLLVYYENCLKRHMTIHGEEKTFLSKNPNSTSKMWELYDHFPDSRFILLIRNPLEQIPSVLNLFKTVWENLSGPTACDSPEFKRLYEINVDMYKYMLRALPRIDSQRIAIVLYDHLIKDPEAVIKSVYNHFGMEISDDFANILSAEKKRHETYKSTHEYSLEKYNLTKEKIYNDLEEVFNTFGFSI
ncbi:MAG: sulfotransferase [Proteobacteria bacterium]|nr:sulfotransferase [Pseudomonadota bacterium]